MFVSKVKIFVKAGNGGKGVVSFRREKYVPYGGPNGGDGGNGGDIIIVGDKSINTLAYFQRNRHFFGEDGQNGSNYDCHGKYGKNAIIKVPVGTALYDKNNKFLCETFKDGEEIILFKGGKGGIGNGKMATSTDRAPRTTIPPEEKEMQEINMVLTLKTDVGILGAPNGGKSSLINILSRANSIVGDYAFTTLNPVLGQMYDSNISLMDLPGIIEDAYKGKGRGIEFLRHSESCKIFIYLIDISQKPEEAYNMIQHEINMYGKKLIDKPYILVFNKIDLISTEELCNFQNLYPDGFFISIKNNININLVRDKILEYFPPEPELPIEDDNPIEEDYGEIENEMEDENI